jgi:predicted AAA+ superfamily ATPase
MTNSSFRLGYAECRALLLERLAAPAPGRIQLLTGPRQVGKTTLLLDLARTLGPLAHYAAADAPEATLPGAWERLWQRAEDVAREQGRAVLLLDEIPYLPDWAARLKGEWDRLRRRHIPIHVVATGSSALGLGLGSRERLAGRFELLTLSHWTARDLALAFTVPVNEAAHAIVTEGAFPGAFPLREDPARWHAYIRDAVLEPALGRDLLALGAVRRPALLRQVFGVAAGSPARIVSLQKIQGALQDRGALETIAHYLRVLEEAYLVAGLEKYSARPLRSRAAPPKLVVLSNAYLAASDARGAPDPALEPERFGAWVENACLAHAVNAGQRVTYWREEPLEVDAIVDGSWGRWAVEVKTGSFTRRDLRGVFEFARRHPRFRPLVLCDRAAVGVARDAGAEALAWEDYLLAGPPGTDGRG